MITAYYGIFEEKLHKQKKDIERELERAKSDRRKQWLKDKLKDTKRLRNLIREMEQNTAKQITCPKCGEQFHG